ncbi:hypothetical protein [Pontibacter fetidus]|uniref:Uncharacterized protein n=1 Tax=Pontibacter fetidus TaxID=2700082 RepID=A0A6B2H711_9BACT|nr:hypothetical protein [Pontibacter fetidus]NDK56666.1 hypothetical protein [Pontibacter fetidus]
MGRAILKCILLLIGLHMTARGLEQLDVIAHFFLITSLGTTLILPIWSFLLLNYETTGITFKSIVIKTFILLLVVYSSYLLDNNFNEHTDQVGRDLGRLSLIAGIVVVCILLVINIIKIQIQKNKKNAVQQGA